MEEIEQMLDIRQAAAILKISRSSLYAHAVDGKVPFFQISGRGKLLFTASGLRKALVAGGKKVRCARIVATGGVGAGSPASALSQ